MMREFFTAIHSIEPEVLDEYLSCWEEIKLPKRTVNTAPGEVERYLYFVLEGVQKAYYLKDGKEYIMAFTYSPSFSGIPESFFTQQPSRYYLETITDSTFLRLSYSKHQEMLKNHRQIETFFRKATELLLVGVMQRQYEIMALDIQERFRSFAERSPHLFNLVSHKDIAAYLRIDPTNFSKLYNSIKI